MIVKNILFFVLCGCCMFDYGSFRPRSFEREVLRSGYFFPYTYFPSYYFNTPPRTKLAPVVVDDDYTRKFNRTLLLKMLESNGVRKR